MATPKARERTNLTENRGAALPPPQRTSSFNGRQLSAAPPQRTSSFNARRSSAPSSPQGSTSSFNARRSSAPSSPQGSISSFNARRSSAPSSPQRTSSFNARRSSAPPSPQRTSSSFNAQRSSAPSSPQRTSSSNGRRSPRPSTPENPLPPVGTDKLRYNHLKARPATPVNAPKSAKSLQPTSTASAKRLPVTKPATEKPPSPYAAPRQFTSLKSSLEKVPKIPTAGAKTGQLARTRSLGSARAAATSIPPRVIGSSIPVPKFAGGNKTGQLSRTMSLGSTSIETWVADINEELAIGMQTEQEQSHIAAPKLDEEQDAADSTLILDRDTEPLELNSDVEGSMQLQEEEEEQAEEVGTESGVAVCEEEEDSKIDEADDTFESKSTGGAENEPAAMEQASEDAKPAKFVRSRTTVAATTTKKETLISHNDVIEEAKSKLLEKRKNRVLALVGAFETVMALQEPDGQPGQG